MKFIFLIITIILFGLALYHFGAGNDISSWLALSGGLFGVITASAFYITSFGILGAATGGGGGAKLGFFVAAVFILGFLVAKLLF